MLVAWQKCKQTAMPAGACGFPSRLLRWCASTLAGWIVRYPDSSWHLIDSPGCRSHSMTQLLRQTGTREPRCTMLHASRAATAQPGGMRWNRPARCLCSAASCWPGPNWRCPCSRRPCRYERHAIEAWLAANGTSPMTGAPLEDTRLLPNHTLAAALRAALGEDACAGRKQ